jgi:hypothetical protein
LPAGLLEHRDALAIAELLLSSFNIRLLAADAENLLANAEEFVAGGGGFLELEVPGVVEHLFLEARSSRASCFSLIAS